MVRTIILLRAWQIISSVIPIGCFQTNYMPIRNIFSAYSCRIKGLVLRSCIFAFLWKCTIHHFDTFWRTVADQEISVRGPTNISYKPPRSAAIYYLTIFFNGQGARLPAPTPRSARPIEVSVEVRSSPFQKAKRTMILPVLSTASEHFMVDWFRVPKWLIFTTWFANKQGIKFYNRNLPIAIRSGDINWFTLD